jgi:hypothetical protein
VADKDELGNKDKNRNIDVVDLEGLSDRYHQVLIFRLQYAGMTQGAIQSPGRSIDKRHSDPQQAQSAPEGLSSTLLVCAISPLTWILTNHERWNVSKSSVLREIV